MSQKETLEGLKYCCACTSFIPNHALLAGTCPHFPGEKKKGTATCSKFELMHEWDTPLFIQKEVKVPKFANLEGETLN